MRHFVGATLAAAISTSAIARPPAESADYRFGYTYPPAAARIPALRAWLDSDRAALKVRVARQAAAGRRAASRNNFPFRGYEAQRQWKVVTETPRLLSLSGQTYTFTGGAHGQTSSTALIWDKTARRRLEPRDLFTSPAAIDAATRTSYCARFKAERQKRVGTEGSGGIFGRCPELKELTLLLGSSTGQRINRIGLIADPYVNGSYAEGIYQVTLPVTPTLLRAVRPTYRAAFAVK